MRQHANHSEIIALRKYEKKISIIILLKFLRLLEFAAVSKIHETSKLSKKFSQTYKVENGMKIKMNYFAFSKTDP